jgi:hypothetical protein
VAFSRRIAFFTADTTVETVATNVTGQSTTAETVICANPSGAAATNILLTIGADAAGTRALVIPVPAGPTTVIIHPNLKFTGTETCQCTSSATDDVCVVSIHGRSEVNA